MNLKYYLRGLGIGIIITALVVSIGTTHQKEQLSTDEIMEKAEELGMIKPTLTLAEVSENNASIEEENTVVEDIVSENEVLEEPKKEPEKIDEQEVTTCYVLVASGDGSHTVALKVKEAGLISDATDFDQYLCQNGYDKRIVTGNHEIETGSSYEVIAKTLISK